MSSTPKYKISIQSWGPAGWIFLKSIALTYPNNPTDKDKEKYRIFFTSVGDVLPCVTCQKHYKQNLSKIPIQLGSKRDISMWINEMENEVNKSIDKPEISFEEFISQYIPPSMFETVGLDPAKVDSFYTERSTDPNVQQKKSFWVMLVCVCAGLVFLIVMLILWKKKSRSV